LKSFRSIFGPPPAKTLSYALQDSGEYIGNAHIGVYYGAVKPEDVGLPHSQDGTWYAGVVAVQARHRGHRGHTLRRILLFNAHSSRSIYANDPQRYPARSLAFEEARRVARAWAEENGVRDLYGEGEGGGAWQVVPDY
jgi:hypothetical protein